MEPEDLPWPGELEEEEAAEEEAAAPAPAEAANSEEVVVVEEVEEAGPELDSDVNYESQRAESSDDEEDEEAKAWLQAHPGVAVTPPPPPRHRYMQAERTSPERVIPLTCHVWQQPLYQGNVRTHSPNTNAVSLETKAQWSPEDDQRRESWHNLPQEVDSSQTLATSQTRINVGLEGTEVTDYPSLEEGELTQSEDQVKHPDRDLLCSPLLVIQDNFASPDLPLLTCLTQDQDSLFHQSELDFAPLRGIPDKSEDTEWFSRPSEVSEALFQATSEVSSDLVNSCFSISQHPLMGSTTVGSQRSFLPTEQENKKENISSDIVDELNTPKDSDNYDTLCSYMSWKTRKDIQQSRNNLADKDQVSVSTLSDISDENIATKRSDGCDASCSHVQQHWKQEAFQQVEPCLSNKNHVSFPHEVAHHNNKMSYSFLRCLLERRGKGVPLTSNSHYFERVCLRAPAENNMKQKIDSSDGYGRNEGLWKEVSQCCEQEETRNNLVSPELHPRSLEIKYVGNIIAPDKSVNISEAHILSRGHDISEVEASGGPLQTSKSNLDETSEELYFQEERNQKGTSSFGEKNVDATENVAFEAVIASIEPSEKESTVGEIQTDISKSLSDDSYERESESPDLSPLNCDDENSFFDTLEYPNYQSTPGVFEPSASKPSLHKNDDDDDDSSLNWYPNLKSSPNVPQKMFIKPLSVTPELKSSSLNEKPCNQAVGLDKTQSALFQCDIYNEPFLPTGKINSVSSLDLAEKVGSSNIIYSMKVSTSDSLVFQDLKHQTFEEVADSSDYNLGKNINSSNANEGLPAAIGSSFSANLMACDAKSQGDLPLTCDASLIAVGQEILLKADIGQGEIPRSLGAESSFTIHTIMQNDSYFVEGLRGKAESDAVTLDDDTECCSIDENADVCSERVAELQRETCDQQDLTGECIELAALEDLLDDLCDSSLHWQLPLQSPCEEESNSEKPVGHSNLGINQSFSSILPPFVPYEPTSELEYHSSDLRMLRVSPDTMPKTLKHLSGDSSKGGIPEITQSKLKSSITITPGDSDIQSHLPLSLEDLPQLAISSRQENTIGQHTDTLSPKTLTDSYLTESLKVSDIPEPSDQETRIPTAPPASYPHREKPNILYQQGLPDGHLTDQSLTVSPLPGSADQKTGTATVPSTSYSRGEKPSILYQQELPDSYPTEEALKVSATPGPADQKTGIPTVISASYSQRDKPGISYQQAFPGSRIPVESLKVSATLGPADQKTGIPTVTSTYQQKDKPGISYQQTFPGSHIPTGSVKVSATPGPADQKTGIPTVTSTYPQRDKPGIFYQQVVPGSHLTEEPLKVSLAPGPADQKTGIPTVTSIYPQRDKPGIFYQQVVPGSHLTEEALKVSAAPGPADQKTGIPTVTSAYPQRDKPGIFYQQAVPGSHLTEEPLKVSLAPGPADQKTGIPTVTSTYPQRDKPGIFYQQVVPGSHLTEEALKVSAAPGPADQKTGIPTVTSAYPQRDKPGIFYQQAVPGSHLTEEPLKVSLAPGPADQKTGIPTVTSTYPQRDKPGIFYQQVVPGSHLTEEALKVSAAPGPADQKTGIPTVTSIYPQRDKPGIFYQQAVPGSHLTEEALRVSAAPGPVDQKTGGIPTVTSTYPQRDKPGIFYQQAVPGSHLTEEALRVSVTPGPADQKTGIPTITSTSYPYRDKPGISYQQALPSSHTPAESLKFSHTLGPADQKTGIPTVTSTSYSYREEPASFYQQELPKNRLTEESLSAIPGPADLKTGITTVSSSSYSHGEDSHTFYHQALPESHLTDQVLKVSTFPRSADQKVGTAAVPSTSYSHGVKSGIFYQQKLPSSHLTEETLKVAAASGLADQKTGIPAVYTSSYSQREKPGIFYQQALPDSHPTKEPLKVSTVSGSADQKTGIPIVTSTSYSQRETSNVFYQQTLSDSHLTEEALKVSVVSGPGDQKTGIPSEISTSYSREKPIIFSQQTLPDSHLTEETLRSSADSGSVDQKAGILAGSSSTYSQREKSSVFYQQELPDSHLPKEALKVSVVPGLADQKSGIPTIHSISHSHIEKPGVFLQQELPDSHPTAKSPKVSFVPGLADQKPGVPTVLSTSYSHRETPVIFYQQTLPDSHLPEKALKFSAVSGPAVQKTDIPPIISNTYSQREKPGIFYHQAVPGSYIPEETLKVSTVPRPTDQKTGIPTVTSTSYSQRDQPGIFYQQDFPGSHIPGDSLNVSVAPGPVDQKTGTPTLSSSSYSLGERPVIFYQQALPDSHLPKETLKVLASGPADLKTGKPTVDSTSYSFGEKPIILYQQAPSNTQLSQEGLKLSIVPGPVNQKTTIPPGTSSYLPTEKTLISHQPELTDSHLTEKATKVSIVLGPTDQKTGKSTVPSTSYSHIEKSSVSYQQEFPDQSEEALKVVGIPGPSDQKIGIQIVSSTLYSQGEQSIVSSQQRLSNLTEVGLKAIGDSGPADQKTGIQVVSSSSYSHRENAGIFHQQELPNVIDKALDIFVLPEVTDKETGISTVPLSYYSYREKPSVSSQQELSDSHLTEEALKVSVVSVPAEQKVGIPIGPSGSYLHREKPSSFYPQALPESDLTAESLKALTVPGLADQKNRIPTVPSSSYSHKEKLKISAVNLSEDQKTELLTSTYSSYTQREKPKISTVIGPDDQKTPLLTVRVQPGIILQQQLPDRDQSEDVLKISTVQEPTDVNTGAPIPLSDSYLHREKPIIFYPQELPDRHLTEDAVKVSSGLGQSDQIIGLSTVSHGEKHKLVSEQVQYLNTSNTSVSSSHIPLNSQADGVVIAEPESLGFGDVGSEEIRDTDNSSKTLKEIRTLLMEAENIALKRCNFPAPLVPFRDVSDISYIQSKKVVCFKEPSTTDECKGDLLQRQPFTEERPSSRCIQKDIGTQTNLKCQRGIENWEFISSTTIRSPLQEAESNARMAFNETLRQYEAAKSVMRSEPEGYSRTIGNKIIIPMMTIISDSSSDISDGNGSCSWDSNLPESLESVSDVLLNFLPYSSPKTSITDSREEEAVSESEDGCGSLDSLAAHVKNLLQCESSLNHAKQILRNAEEEECRVRARAWNLKLNLAHDYGYSISELNEDDRRKVEEIKAELFGHGRTTHLSEGSQSPRGIGCKPEAVCSHIIIESHEKGCFRTLTAEQPQLDSHTCVFRYAEPSEMIRGRQSPSPWRARHTNLSKSLDQNNAHCKVCNSLQLQSHSPLHNLIPDDFKISKGLRVPFHEKMDPWLSELVEPACMPPNEVDFHSSSQIPTPEPMKQFTTSITVSSHRHSQCISDSSVFKVGVTEGSQYTGSSVGVFNSHVTEEQNSPRDLKQKTSSPSSLKMPSRSPNKVVTILAEGSRQSQKLPVDFEHSYQEEKLLERSDFKVSHSEPSASGNCSTFKEVHFSDNHTLVSMGRPSSTLGVKEKNVTITSDLPSHIFLEQRELFEQSKAPLADHHVRKPYPPLCPDLPSCIFLEQRELFEQSKAPHVDHEMRECHTPVPQCQDYIAPDLPSPIFVECQSEAPGVDDQMRKYHLPPFQGQDCVVEKNQHTPKSYISDMINVEAKFDNVICQSAPDPCSLATSASTPPSNRKALSCVRITLCPKTTSKLDSGNLDNRFHSLDSASKTRMNSEFNSDLQTISSRSLEPTSKLLTSKPVAQNQESLGFLGSKSPLDFQVVQSPLPDSNTVTQDLKTIPSQNSQIVTSRQTQVNFSDLERYSKPEGTPVSADRSPEQSKTSLSSFSGKLSSDAVTQITTESPEKTMFSSEIFINPEDHGSGILEPSTKRPSKGSVKFASSTSLQQIATSRETDAQPLLLPYKPSGITRMYYVPQLEKVPPILDSKSDTTIESSHSVEYGAFHASISDSGSNDAIAPDFPAQVLGTRDDDLSTTVNIKHKEGIYSKRATTKAPLLVERKPFQKDNAEAPVQMPITGDESLSDGKQKEEIFSQKAVTKTAWPEEKEPLPKDTAGSSGAPVGEHSAKVQDKKIENLPDTKAIKQKEEIHVSRTTPKEAWSEEKKSLQIDISESECHSEFENTTHSVFRSAKFYFHHPVHLPSDQDFCHESLGRSVFMRHSWKDFFHHHSDKHREYTCLPSPYQNVDKTVTDYTRIKRLSINVNLGDKEVKHTTQSQASNHPKSNRQINNPKGDHKVTPEPTTEHTVSLNDLWNKYQERQKQQKPPDSSDKKELSLVERLDRLAKLLQNPITHSLQASESTQDESRGDRVKEWSGKQQQQHQSKLQKQKRLKSVEKGHKYISDLKKSKGLSPHQSGRSNQIKIEQIKFDKYILRKQPDLNYISNTSSDSRPSEESELLTDSPTNILSTSPSPVESDILIQTDREVALHERSSSVSTIDTARLIQAFGHERVCLSPRRIKLYSSITNQQRRYLEKRCKQSRKALNVGHPQMTSEHTRRRHIQVENHMLSSDSLSSASSFLSLNSVLGNGQNVHVLNKGVQAGNLEIVNGTKKHTRDVGVTFPTPSSSEARLEEDSDATSWSEEKIEEKKLFTSYLGDKKLRKNKQNPCKGVSWFVPVENAKSGSKKENLPEIYGPGISWFEPITKTKPWREPLREQNWQGQCTASRASLAGPGGDDGRGPPKPFVRATLQESLHLHRPDFISRSGERIKRLKLVVQERKLQNMFQSERDTLFNTTRPLHGRVFLSTQKNKPIGKKEMIQRSKRIYEQLPEVQKKREEEKRRQEYKSYRLRAQLYKKRVTNQLLGRKVPWN